MKKVFVNLRLRHKIACSGALLVALLLLAGYLYYRKPDVPQAQDVLFQVERGSSATAISIGLQKAGLVRSSRVFLFIARALRLDGKFQAGYYKIALGTPQETIMRMISGGKQNLERITVPEGYTSRMIGELLERNGVCKALDFVAAVQDPERAQKFQIDAPSLEGYLYPETYMLDRNMSIDTILTLMVDAFRRQVAQLPGLRSLNQKDLHHAVILASIVEREYRAADEAPLIASVFLNRLKLRMPLQSCATVVYVLTEEQGKPHPQTVRYVDLRIDNAFNTYLYRGLPPAPIANPGPVSLAAVSDPAKTRYLYFRLVDADNGRHHFSSTLEEHDQASQKVKGF